MREEPRRDDVYAWSRPRVPEGDPYVWMDMAQIAGNGQPPAPTPEAGLAAPVVETADANVIAFPVPSTPEPEVQAAVAPLSGSTDEVWVELPAAPEPAPKPARARRSRAKAKPAPEAVEAEAVEADAVAEAPAAEASVAVAVAEVEPEPVVAEAAPAPAEPEPAAVSSEPEPLATPPAGEISTPPEKPRRGWWRRGA